MDITKKNLSRRTVATGVAWTVPAVAVASAVPAFASSPGKVIIVTPMPGEACKFGGSSCTGYKHAYRFVFCFTNTSDQDIEVKFTNLKIEAKPDRVPTPPSLTVPAGAVGYCQYILVDEMGNSQNGKGTLYFEYEYDGELVKDSIETGANDLPPCDDCADDYANKGQGETPDAAAADGGSTDDAAVEEVVTEEVAVDAEAEVVVEETE